MHDGIVDTQIIETHRVFLDLENPRSSTPFESQDEAIKWLCDNENVVVLAKDIREIGTNPLELLAVMKRGNAYIALEGNRRLCAIMLLGDPELAPAAYRQRFSRLAEGWDPITELVCVEFDNRRDAQVWLDRIHGGEDEGRGRSSWSAEVKARRTRSRSSRVNVLPLSLIDYAVKNGLLSKEDKEHKLAIVLRFSSNPVFKNLLGIKPTKTGFDTTMPRSSFDKLLGRLFADIVGHRFKAHDFDSQAVRNYVNTVLAPITLIEDTPNESEGAPEKECESDEPEDLIESDESDEQPRPQSPSMPQVSRTLPFSSRIEEGLGELGNFKLRKIYYSVVTISIKKHCPLLYVGLWSLLECLTALDGRNVGTNFAAYLSARHLKNMGLGNSSKRTQSMRNALEHILALGNGTKHDVEAAGFNYVQLYNDYKVVEIIIEKLVERCIEKKNR